MWGETEAKWGSQGWLRSSVHSQEEDLAGSHWDSQGQERRAQGKKGPENSWYKKLVAGIGQYEVKARYCLENQATRAGSISEGEVEVWSRYSNNGRIHSSHSIKTSRLYSWREKVGGQVRLKDLGTKNRIS